MKQKLTKYLLFIVMWLSCIENNYSQCPTIALIEDIENDVADRKLSTNEGLQKLVVLKLQSEHCGLTNDSVYARILHRIASYKDDLLGFPDKTSIDYTLLAIKINTSKTKGASPGYAVHNYLNMSIYYDKLGMYNESLAYADSAIHQAEEYPSEPVYKIVCRIEKANLYQKRGDYVKCIEECTKGIKEAKEIDDLEDILDLFNRRSNAFFYQEKIVQCAADADSALSYAKMLSGENTLYQYANALKTKAMVYENAKQFSKADSFYKEAIKVRVLTGEVDQIENDYVDIGNFALTSLHDTLSAKKYYQTILSYAQKAHYPEGIAKASNNLGVISYYQNNFAEAGSYYTRAFTVLRLAEEQDILKNPTITQLNTARDYELILDILNNKTHLLACIFNQTHLPAYLIASLQTAKLTDSFITRMRHVQVSEISKLYWRNRTREFYAHAIEACNLANDAELAFFFFEKSRAVLLDEKLSELGAAGHLPLQEILKQQEFKQKIILAQQKLAGLKENTLAYNDQELQLAHVQEDFDNYIKSLETNFKAYYQYKYDDYVLPLKALQTYLEKNHQSFIDYFFNDTVCYILALHLIRSHFLNALQMISAVKT